ncbi:hypothetical protein C8034_v008405 [Colletotrichum sidae]|uniref:Uncharacterized protein n=1 Tax=Colletotrichum sidae TaxID=1347389 RepID=A0A4V3I4T7_9PEZI|nr:hypothetical protein C8034_v008405 [Colletotrichum sidae]
MALSISSLAALASARPDNLRARTPPNPNTCACPPADVILPSTITTTTTATTTATAMTTKTETVRETTRETSHETSHETSPVIKETVTVSPTLTFTLTVTHAPVTETFYVSDKHPAETVTVTCTETVSELPDGSTTTKTKPSGTDQQTKTHTSVEGSETEPPKSDGESTSKGAVTVTRTTVQSVKPVHPSGGSSDPGKNEGTSSRSDEGPRPAPTSTEHCELWDGTRCVEPTTPPATATMTTLDANPTNSVCSVSVAFVTIYNTITATVYEGGSASHSATGPGHVPRAPTVVAAL